MAIRGLGLGGKHGLHPGKHWLSSRAVGDFRARGVARRAPVAALNTMVAVEIEAACAPLSRPEKIEALLGSAEQYAEASVPVLESYVAAQVSGKTYDALANKALMKLYQFTPARCSDEVLALVLAKAMMARPAGDLTSLLYVVPEALVERCPLAAKLAACDALLEASKFAEFWAAAREKVGAKAVADLVPGFTAAVRRYLLDLLSQTFERVPLDLLAEVLGIDAAAAAGLAKSPPPGGLLLPSTDAANATFAPNAHNQKRKETSAKGIQLDALLSCFAEPDEDIFSDE